MRPAFVLLGVVLLLVLLSPVQVAAMDGDSTTPVSGFTETSTDDSALGLDMDSELDQDRNGTDSWFCACEDAAEWYDEDGTFDSITVVGSDYVELNGTYDSLLPLYAINLDPAVTESGRGFVFYVRFWWYANNTVAIRLAIDNSVKYVDLDDYAAETWTEYASSATATASNYQMDFVFLQVIASDGTFTSIRLDYVAFTSLLSYENDTGTVYAESFADVSDISIRSTSGLAAGEYGFGSDDDVAEFWICPGDTGDEYAYWNVPSSDMTPTISRFSYIEVRWNREASSAAFYLYVEDTDGVLRYVTSSPDGWNTYRGFLGTVSGLATDVRQISFCLNDNPNTVATGNYSGWVDYVRVWEADQYESGWQHDGSTTQGVTAGGGTVASDGDKLTLTADADGSTFDVVFDTTATAAALSLTYYPFLELSITGGSGTWQLQQYDGSAYATLQSSGTLATGTYRYNMRSQDTSITKLTFTLGNSGTLTYDHAKAYSIANWTVTQHGTTPVSHYLYTSSGALYRVGSSASQYWITINHDPAVSIAQATYQVWNLTASDSDPTSRNDWCVQLWNGAWDNSFDETRGDTPTGTVTDVSLITYNANSYSALKFITDATKPDVVRANAAPTDADDTEAVTLSAVATDAIEVYEVYFNAITYPSGFSDTNYYAEEQSENLWNYTFSTLSAGYYCFAVYASDGANTNDLDYYSYIDFTVREASISISPISFFGAGEDFGMMTVSFEIDRDATYTIYEASATYSETDTHTGSVLEGWNNIAWDKLSLTDNYANFSIYFVAGSLSTWVNGSYAVARDTFYFSAGPLIGEAGPTNGEYVWASGRLSKPATYTVYADDVQQSTGSTDEQFFISVAKIEPLGANHDYAFRFVNGSQTLWVNGTFYTYQYAKDAEEQGGELQWSDWRMSEKFWVMFGVLAAVVGIGAIYFRLGERERRLIT